MAMTYEVIDVVGCELCGAVAGKACVSTRSGRVTATHAIRGVDARTVINARRRGKGSKRAPKVVPALDPSNGFKEVAGQPLQEFKLQAEGFSVTASTPEPKTSEERLHDALKLMTRMSAEMGSVRNAILDAWPVGSDLHTSYKQVPPEQLFRAVQELIAERDANEMRVARLLAALRGGDQARIRAARVLAGDAI